MMKYFLIIVCMLFPFFNAYAGDSIVIYRMGGKDQAVWGLLKKSFDSKGYNVSIYEKADNIDRHLETINRINKTNASLVLAMDLQTSEKTDVLIAFADAKKGTGRFLTIEEVTGQHTDNSMILAEEVATSFGRRAKGLSLFPLLGIDMPGIFIKIECTNEQANEMLNKLHEGIQKFMKRGQ
ncbi:MAG: hypothetical protein NTX36_12080 [Proteobacteria bacterium]|nr:hypothetical protein [Pseudomonadota bacterium]